jgi:hypothetical protein
LLTFRWLSFGRASFFSLNTGYRTSDSIYEKDAQQQQYLLWEAAIMVPQMKRDAIVG